MEKLLLLFSNLQNIVGGKCTRSLCLSPEMYKKEIFPDSQS